MNPTHPHRITYNTLGKHGYVDFAWVYGRHHLNLLILEMNFQNESLYSREENNSKATSEAVISQIKKISGRNRNQNCLFENT